MQVRAIATGFYGCYRVAGDVFDVPGGAKATWFVPVKGAPGTPPKHAPAPTPPGSDLV